MPIIDFRLRPPLKGFLNMVMYANGARRDRITGYHGMQPAPSAQSQSIDLLLEEMDAAGITLGVVMGRDSGLYGSVTNEDVADIVSAYPDRFMGAASIDPGDARAAIRRIDHARTLGLKAINIEPGGYSAPLYADDRRLYPIYDYCEAGGWPVVIMGGGSAGPDLGYTHPMHIDRVAGDFPKMKLAISHGGWPWVREVLHIAFRRANVYVSPDQYLCNMPGMDDYIRAANGFLADRFLFASSYPFLSVRDYAQWFRALPIKDDVMEKLLYRNAAEFLGLD